MTDEQIEKAAQQHADELRVSHSIPGALVPMLHDIAKSSYTYGAQDALSHQWISVDERLPPGTCLLMCINAREDKAYALCVYIRGRFMIYDHTLSYKREFYPTHWMPIPPLNPEKQSI